MAHVVPGILETQPEAFSQKIRQLPPDVATIHIDVIDTSYGVAATLVPFQWQIQGYTGNIMTHLMVSDPLRWIDDAIAAGSKTVIAGVEDVASQEAFIKTVMGCGARAGLAINLNTPVTALDYAHLPRNPLILLMAINAGKAGQVFESRVIEKIKLLRQNLGDNAEIAADGGITPETGKFCLSAGANTLIANSYIWQDFPANLRILQAL